VVQCPCQLHQQYGVEKEVVEVMVLYKSNVLASQMLLETIAINVLMDSMDFQIVKVGFDFQ
jgi:hypothetical protein